MEINTKLYVCLDDNNKLSIQTRQEIDDTITKAEENPMGSMDYTVVGSLENIDKKNYFITFVQNKKSVFYDVVEAENEDTVKDIITNKKRFKKQSLDFKRIVDLTNLIKEYFS